ncbi:GPW/gp25 family protein [Chitinophaga sp. sic0106]|uniref:GPW/gp25 family protein n=1 Tax=Chitinophaga sp. sic0106 TaxID=2854785 RepID=UPI001C488AEA|nr:GPW/gp25 family protein [Chitinophaga sp. sic0106]MBV7529400.1 GPW/gp25 family protein [Chitinophaga sp. sic0106]
MAISFYKKPFDFSRVFSNSPLETCDSGASIAQHIELIIFTRFGEHRFNSDFGCEVWELDFQLIVNQSMWEDHMCRSLEQAVTSQEQRLYGVSCEISITDVEKIFPLRRITEIKKRVDIIIKGKLAATGENYVFNTALFLSPLSSE